ncbi:MAG: tRNA (adenosine(37)-N6)-threonylcarbamoyltransferase complex transferase subunit TsaD [Planctomycetia bacterium]|nr:tRNA (adenosine(37)-N6)-threonylcarbamoyltransferase complex transferase subunit TsaD [Planctomycetia bacterium]
MEADPEDASGENSGPDRTPRVLGSVVASQIDIHRIHGGVVPEIASRAHLEKILPVLEETLRQAETSLEQLDAIAVAYRPGLAGSLIVGVSSAKALCVATGKPLLGIDHLQAHIYACRIAARRDVFPCIGLIVSGGHTSLYRCRSPLDFEPLGGTIDDAAGEAFDKVAAMLGLPYPGGPWIQRVAESGDAKAYRFPRPFLNDHDRLDFSFSGLKTAVRYTITGPGRADFSEISLSSRQISDIAASFQAAVADCLTGKAILALRKTGMSTLCVGGGVAANAAIRSKLFAESEKRGITVHIAPPDLCTDNAVMGAIAVERYRAGLFESLDLDIGAGVLRCGGN